MYDKAYKLKGNSRGETEIEAGDLFAEPAKPMKFEPVPDIMPPKEATHEERIGQVLDHFSPPGPESVTALEAKEMSEELLSEYKLVCDRFDALEKIKASLRATILDLTKGEPGTQLHGNYMLTLKPRAGQVKIDWEGWAREEVGVAAVDALLKCRESVKKGEMDHAFVNRGEDGLTVDVKEIGSGS
jgi:hypothetical protein